VAIRRDLFLHSLIFDRTTGQIRAATPDVVMLLHNAEDIGLNCFQYLSDGVLMFESDSQLRRIESLAFDRYYGLTPTVVRQSVLEIYSESFRSA
jgi:hypothetical protein